MKTNIILIMLLLTGCSSTEPRQLKKISNTMNHVEMANIHRAGFCEGSKLFSYLETTYYTSLTCADGRFFMVPKN